ncbi:MAG: DUF1428 domain-containing protein [Geminicoccaceae bacterium]
MSGDASYYDIMSAAVPVARRDEYVAHAREAAVLFREHGALSVVETWGDDVPGGKLTSFPLAVKQGEGEAVVVSWIAWPSKAVRDAAWAKMMDDPRMDPVANPMPFDGKRLIHGGFAALDMS